jgi:hypothetical protein
MVAAILPLGSLNGLEDHETNELSSSQWA